MKKSQTATEYMIILAVVLIIAFIVVSTLGGIPQIGGNVGNRVTEAELRSGKIGITSYSITEDKTIATIQNNERETVTINSFNLKGIECDDFSRITLAPGQSRNFECENFNSSQGTSFGNDVPVQVSYTTYAGAVFNQEYGDVTLPWCNPEWGIILPFDDNLCWQQEVSGVAEQYDNRSNYCHNLVLGDLDDWDMPTRTEMVKLRNYACEKQTEGGACDPMYCNPYIEENCDWVSGDNLHIYLNNHEGFTGFDEGWYWTKTPYEANQRWVVFLEFGSVATGSTNNIQRVVCVSRK